VVLPDATVLSAGGGEFKIGPDPNAPADTHRDAQVFRPPYLFRGPRPAITAAPDELTPGRPFMIEVSGPDVARVTLLRLGSVTHAFDENQRFLPVPFTTRGATLTATLPARPGVCVPGHYMLFALSAAGVPSVARIVRIAVATAVAPQPLAAVPRAEDRERRAVALPSGTRITVGLTAQCPYGLAACWGGAYEALSGLSGVSAVAPDADAADSTAEVYVAESTLPDLGAWPDEIARSANGSYTFRGIELTLDGTVERRGDDLVLRGLHPEVRLTPLAPDGTLAWDLATRAPRPATADELDAHRRAAEHAGEEVRVTGPTTTTADGWSLAVRLVDTA
jgi:galactose oxidase